MSIGLLRKLQGLEPLWSLQRLNGSADVGNVRILLVPLSETNMSFPPATALRNRPPYGRNLLTTSFATRSIAFDDISNRILADRQIPGDPAIASAFRDERQYLWCELV